MHKKIRLDMRTNSTTIPRYNLQTDIEALEKKMKLMEEPQSEAPAKVKEAESHGSTQGNLTVILLNNKIR